MRLALTGAAVVFFPNQYESRGTILLTAKSIPDEFVPTTIISNIIEQFETISGQSGAVDRIRERWKIGREQLQQKKEELEQLEQRVQTLVSAAQLIPDDDDLELQINLLSSPAHPEKLAILMVSACSW